MTEYKKIAKALRACAHGIRRCDDCYQDPKGFDCSTFLMRDAANAFEEIQAQLPKRGKWEATHRHENYYRRCTGIDDKGEEHTITVHHEAEYDWLRCPYCKAAAADNYTNYCPNCGARMKEARHEGL